MTSDLELRAESQFLREYEVLAREYGQARRTLQAHLDFGRIVEMREAEAPADLLEMIMDYEAARKPLVDKGVDLKSIVPAFKPVGWRFSEEINFPVFKPIVNWGFNEGMNLENITGSLLAYKELEPGTFQHSDQLTTERRTNHKLKSNGFYTADGELYTIQKGKHLWAITREPQNLVLQYIGEAYRQLTSQGNYFPEAEAGRASLEHEDTVVVDLRGLKLVKNNDQYGHFVVNPKNVKKLNSAQKRAAQRIYGPDEENFGLNMEMFAEAGKKPKIFVLMPDYVQGTLRSNDKEFLGRASWLGSFSGISNFDADDRYVGNRNALRGVRRSITEGDAQKK